MRTPLTRRRVLGMMAGSAAGWLAGNVLQAATGGSRRPNVILILADDLGWVDTSFTGSTFYRTPNIERLAARSVYFPNAYSASPLCSPTRASIMTGQSPARTGITTPGCHTRHEVFEASVPESAAAHVKLLGCRSVTRLKPEYHTLAEAVRGAGYSTGHFGKWHLGPDPYDPLHHGFDVDIPHWPGPGPAGSFVAPWKFPNFEPRTPKEHIEDRMGDEAVAFMEGNRDKPFFLNYWQFSVHAPFDAKEELIEEYRQRVDPDNPQRSPTYAAMVHALDDNVGKVLDAVERLGIADNTIIIFYSDNGGNMYNEVDGTTPTSNSPLRGGKGSMYEGGIRVPALVAWPGVVAGGTRREALIQSEDLYPTILEMTGAAAEPEQPCDGVSMVPFLRGEAAQVRNAVYCYFPHSPPRVPDHLPPSVCVRKGDWKLIRMFHDGDKQQHRYELYDLKNDIGERNDLAAERPDKVKELDALIEQFLTATNAVVPRPNPRFRPDARESIGGWKAGANGHAEISAADGGLRIVTTASDPQLITAAPLAVPAGSYVLELRMRANAKGNGQVFCAGPSRRVVPGTGVSFVIKHDDQWREYRVRLQARQGVGLIRVDPGSGAGEMRIQSIRLTKPEGGEVQDWSFSEGEAANGGPTRGLPASAKEPRAQ